MTFAVSDEDRAMWRAEAMLGDRYREWWGKIPHVPFKPEWDVRAQPPFGGAMVIYSIQHGDAHVSVYLDCYYGLGCMGEPYWEIHPDATGEDCDRFLMAQTQELVDGIAASITGQLERNVTRT